MSFKLEKTKQAVFDCLDGMLTYVEQEKKNTSRITIGGLISEGAVFWDDESCVSGYAPAS
jgi:hypothetical protein